MTRLIRCRTIDKGMLMGRAPTRDSRRMSTAHVTDTAPAVVKLDINAINKAFWAQHRRR